MRLSPHTGPRSGDVQLRQVPGQLEHGGGQVQLGSGASKCRSLPPHGLVCLRQVRHRLVFRLVCLYMAGSQHQAI